MRTHPHALRRPLAALAVVAATTLSAASAPPAWALDGAPEDAARAACVPTVTPAAGETVGGLDVSHWQGAIDWTGVAETERRFVFMKATDGRTEIDERFAENYSGARGNGLVAGAYHFARPDRRSGDPVREARHFVSVADPRAGDLLPVLDIENNGPGLNTDQMTRWARRWVEEVRRLTGVHPLVYTSPCGWKDRFADTRRIARGGSPLWVAHWSAGAPMVPADNWNGRGWVVWQHSSTGHVRGIAGAVDLDRFNGTDLGVMTIRRLRIDVAGAGIVTSAPGGYGCATACDRTTDPDAAIVLTAKPDDGAIFTGWDGACAGSGPMCTLMMHGNRTVSASFATDVTAPTPSLEPPDGFTDATVVRFDEVVRGVTAANVQLRTDGGSVLDVTRSCRSGSGATVTCATGSVRSVRLVPGRPLVPGGDYEAVVDPVGAQPVLDRVGNPAPRTALEFEAARAVEEGDAPIDVVWRTVDDPSAYGGSYAVERLGGAELSFDFKGRSVTWYTMTGPNAGKAEVLVDGRSERVVDLYATHRHAKVARVLDGLGRGRHTLTIRALGRARPAATGRLVAVDAFDTASRGLVRTPATSERWRTVDAPDASAGSLAVADLGGAAITLRFDGTGIDWTTFVGPDRGTARVFVDDVLVDTVDLYAAGRAGMVQQIRGFSDGRHTLRIVVTGSTGPDSDGTVVAVDRFEVVGP
jgi:GH25 family lysozyme M1 (1,4-beta-N-acetylmuramidase)